MKKKCYKFQALSFMTRSILTGSQLTKLNKIVGWNLIKPVKKDVITSWISNIFFYNYISLLLVLNINNKIFNFDGLNIKVNFNNLYCKII